MSRAEIADVGFEKVLGEESKGILTDVWKYKEEGWVEGGKISYFSVNANTIESEKEGFNLKELGDKKWIEYLDVKDQVHVNHYDHQHKGRMW